MKKNDLISEKIKQLVGDFTREVIYQNENSRLICFKSISSSEVYSFGETKFLNIKKYPILYEGVLSGKLLGETLLDFFKDKLVKESDSFIEIYSTDFIRKVIGKRFLCRNTKFSVLENGEDIILVEIKEYLSKEIAEKLGVV